MGGTFTGGPDGPHGIGEGPVVQIRPFRKTLEGEKIVILFRIRFKGLLGVEQAAEA
jgi:hypothetical protein